MKKNKLIITIIISIMCFLLTYITFVQIKTVEETDITSIEAMREDELRTELASWKSKYEETEEKLGQVKATVSEYEENETTSQKNTELLEKELSEQNLLVGKTNVKGEGVIVTLTDNQFKNIEAYDILQLLNELKLAGAEAISINDNRVINTTDVVDVNNIFIVVEGTRITSPYVIKAIGNQKYLQSGLVTKSGYVDVIEANDKTVNVETGSNIEILKYNKDITLKYIEEVK